MAEQVDARVSKTRGLRPVRVRPPLPAPRPSRSVPCTCALASPGIIDAIARVDQVDGASTIARATTRSSNAIPTLLKTVRSSVERRTSAPRTASARSADHVSRFDRALGDRDRQLARFGERHLPGLDHDPPPPHGLGVELSRVGTMGSDRVHVDPGREQRAVEQRFLGGRARADQVRLGDRPRLPRSGGQSPLEAGLDEGSRPVRGIARRRRAPSPGGRHTSPRGALGPARPPRRPRAATRPPARGAGSRAPRPPRSGAR